MLLHRNDNKQEGSGIVPTRLLRRGKYAAKNGGYDAQHRHTLLSAVDSLEDAVPVEWPWSLSENGAPQKGFNLLPRTTAGQRSTALFRLGQVGLLLVPHPSPVRPDRRCSARFVIQ